MTWTRNKNVLERGGSTITFDTEHDAAIAMGMLLVVTEPEPAKGLTWVKRKSLVADWECWQIVEMDGEVAKGFIADFIWVEEIADRIIADHNAQAELTALRTQLDAAREALTTITRYGYRGADIAKEALAALSEPQRTAEEES